jgi:hypothetical protein
VTGYGKFKGRNSLGDSDLSARMMRILGEMLEKIGYEIVR